MVEQPSGTVTMLFSDIEGSTNLVRRLGRERYAEALDQHRRLLREAFQRHGGYEVDCEGDSFFVAFAAAGDATGAAAEAGRALAAAEWPEGCELRVRMGLHTGEPMVAPPKYVGLEVHRAARIMAAGHGGQVLLSQTTRNLLDGDFALRDLGEHRLKDFSEPERIYQLGSAPFPPLKTLHQTNLPIPTTPFLGRGRELDEVLALLANDEVRLLTLTGTGGTGKTRLAIQAATQVSGNYPDGVWWIPLAQLRDPELVLATAGQTLGAKAGLAEHIADRSLLLVFDNFEHLIDGAADLAALLASCPRLHLLVTSREPLHLTGEQEYPVPPFVAQEGVGFFMARARTVDPSFQADDAVPEICLRLDGLPLALELAAARVKVLAPSQILERLGRSLDVIGSGPGDLPERQRTLRAAVEWSYELLEDAEQELFGRLSVFAGSFDLEAAEAVGGGDLETLASLVDKSLLGRLGHGRFAMLHVLREYARERLDAAGGTHELLRTYASYYRSLADRIQPQLRTSQHLEAIDRLETDKANFVRAVEWAAETGDSGLALDLFGKLRHLWWHRCQLEGRVLADRVLALPTEPTAARANALHAAAALALGADLERAVSLEEQALEIYEGLGDQVRAANSLVFIANVYPSIGREGAREMTERGLAALDAAGDDYDATIAMANLSDIALQEGDFVAAAQFAERAAARANAGGFADVEATATFNEALALVLARDPRAADAARSALHLAAATKMHLFAETSLVAVAAAIARSEPGRAAVLLGAVEAELHDAQLPAAERAVYDMATTAVRAALEPSSLEEAVEDGRRLALDEAVEMGLRP